MTHRIPSTWQQLRTALPTWVSHEMRSAIRYVWSTVDWSLKLKSIHANFNFQFSRLLNLGRKWERWLDCCNNWDVLPSWNGFILNIAHFVDVYTIFIHPCQQVRHVKDVRDVCVKTCILMHPAHVEITVKLIKEKTKPWIFVDNLGHQVPPCFLHCLCCGYHLPLNEVVWTAHLPRITHPKKNRHCELLQIVLLICWHGEVPLTSSLGIKFMTIMVSNFFLITG